MRGGTAVAAACLLALAACNRSAPVSNSTSAPPAPAPTVGAPVPDTSGSPPQRFIVCPGNPRCPPAAGNRPEAKPEN